MIIVWPILRHNALNSFSLKPKRLGSARQAQRTTVLALVQMMVTNTLFLVVLRLSMLRRSREQNIPQRSSRHHRKKCARLAEDAIIALSFVRIDG